MLDGPRVLKRSENPEIMINYRFERAARRNRSKALILTLLFHAVLLGGLLLAGNEDARTSLPDPVRQLLGWEKPVTEEAPRP